MISQPLLTAVVQRVRDSAEKNLAYGNLPFEKILKGKSSWESHERLLRESWRYCRSASNSIADEERLVWLTKGIYSISQSNSVLLMLATGYIYLVREANTEQEVEDIQKEFTSNPNIVGLLKRNFFPEG